VGHPASYPMGTRGSFPGGKATCAWSWPLTSRMRGAIPPLLNKPSWRGAQLKESTWANSPLHTFLCFSVTRV